MFNRVLGASRHVVVALVTAPILAWLAWSAIGQWSSAGVTEPSIAMAGNAYPLVEQPGCRYAGGRCKLANESMVLELSMLDATQISAVSSVPLDFLLIGLAVEDVADTKLAAVSDTTRREWLATLAKGFADQGRLRLVAGVGGAVWFGEASMTFTQGSTRTP